MTTTPLYGFSDTSFQAAGGLEGIRKLVDDFYAEMDRLPRRTDFCDQQKTCGVKN